MKTYEKPKLIALSLAANDMLCSNCGEQTKVNTDLNKNLIDIYGDSNSNQIFDADDAKVYGLFGSGEEECSQEVEGYCKFTSAYSIIFTS